MPTSTSENENPYKIGDRVAHDRYGHGTVVGFSEQGNPSVKFDGRDKRVTVPPGMLSPARFSEPDNDNKPLPCIDPADWQDKAIPERNWYIEGMIPGRQVTLLSGDGGTGKSLLAYQVGIAGALGIETIGLEPRPGRVIYLAAEDDEDELIRRGHDILRPTGHSFADLRDKMRIMPMAGLNAELMYINPDRQPVFSDMATKVEELVKTFEPELLILDTSADLYGGDENNRVHVRFFVTRLRKLAMDHNVAVLLLSHPSVAGMQSGSGTSGSTAWNNSVRSRLYLTADKEDDDLRVLKGMKANYSAKGGELKLRWHEGAFILDDGKPSEAAGLINRHTDAKFRELLSAINRSGQRVAPTKGVNYAPSVMVMRPEAKGTSKKALEASMHRLLSEGIIKVVIDGPPSKQRQRLIVSAEDFGPEGEEAAEAA
jgi:RecA-family ATPase